MKDYKYALKGNVIGWITCIIFMGFLNADVEK